jgi:dTDP-4-amino-4,6-dideoxygalactose transaminase
MKGQNLIRFHKPNMPKNIDVSDILKSGYVSSGKYVIELEKLLCKMHRAKYAVCFGSTTSSILMLFWVLRNDRNISVSLPSFTWKSPKIALNMLKISTRWMDIDKETWTPTIAEQKTWGDVNYIFLTSVLGRIPEIAYPEKTIVDAATNSGYFDMKKHPCLAIIVGFSPAKMITGIEGGAVITNNKFLYEILKEIRPVVSRMCEINAKIAIKNLKRIDELRDMKICIYEVYKHSLPFAKFQKIDENHSLSEIAAIFPFSEKQWKQVAKGMEIRKRYDPDGYGVDAIEVYKGVMSLPSYLGCDYKGVIKLLRKVYYG